MIPDPSLRCPVCHGPLYPPGWVRLAGDHRVYCSAACRQKAWRLRHPELSRARDRQRRAA